MTHANVPIFSSPSCNHKIIVYTLFVVLFSIPEHVESTVLSQTLQRFDSESEERMSDDSPSTLKRASTERRSIIQRYRKLMKRESRDFANSTDENGKRSVWLTLPVVCTVLPYSYLQINYQTLFHALHKILRG